MAFIGLQHVVAAPITSETEGQAVVYGAGMVIGKAIQANFTLNHSDNPLYADDAEAENDNSLTGGTIELGLDDLLDDARVMVLGDEAVTVGEGTSATTEYETNGEASPYLGVGYVRVRRKNGVTTYQANWIHKVQFAENSENAQTKGQNLEWQTPTIIGRIMAVKNDSTLKPKYRRRASFNTLAAAVAWVNAKAIISATAGGTGGTT